MCDAPHSDEELVLTRDPGPNQTIVYWPLPDNGEYRLGQSGH